MTRNCLYLVSSSATREYVVDCLEALALPRGMIQHFRYRFRYVDEGLRSSLVSESGEIPSELRDLPVLVVYLFQTQTVGVWKPAETMGPGGPYLPLRCGQLINAFRDGEIAHFFFELSDYVKSDKEASTRVTLNKEVDFRLAPSKPERSSYAHLSRDLGFQGSKDDDTLNFQSIVDFAYLPGEWRTRSLGSVPLDVTYDIIFFRVAGLFREYDKHLKEITPTARFVQGNVFAEYELESGAIYHIRLATHLASERPAQLPGEGRAKVRLVFDPKIIRPLGPTTLRISSMYDLEYWSFVVDCTKPIRSVLGIECECDAVPNREDFVRKELLCPEISFSISVVPASS